eukprot:CAMPEP_0114497760 /NCGR_PEP_ID=MMETSP0109-20121206/6505_1 /TAXON_ID=29199 /ORGANISM="Chlorarachnion reptans, Strain CCCM449" /LENGTH=101 /DNA_ID=CAMNT_0001675181 /DNA_START=1410 /DNA_END=1713 /DNA_ORIENTATION=-
MMGVFPRVFHRGLSRWPVGGGEDFEPNELREAEWREALELNERFEKQELEPSERVRGRRSRCASPTSSKPITGLGGEGLSEFRMRGVDGFGGGGGWRWRVA